MFCIRDNVTTLETYWRTGCEKVTELIGESDNQLCERTFATKEEAKKYIEKFFIGRCESFSISWYDRDGDKIDCYVETIDTWLDDDDLGGGWQTKEHRLNIIELA